MSVANCLFWHLIGPSCGKRSVDDHRLLEQPWTPVEVAAQQNILDT
jgi:hypothetical protein